MVEECLSNSGVDFDALDLRWCVNWENESAARDKLLNGKEGVLELAKLECSFQSKCPTVKNKRQWHVPKMRRYLFTNHLIFGFEAQSRPAEYPGLILQALGKGCQHYNVDQLHEKSFHLMEALGGTVISEAVHRLDIRADLPGNHIPAVRETLESKRYIPRSRKYRIMIDEDKKTTIYIGVASAPIQLCIYQKGNATRFEFRFRRKLFIRREAETLADIIDDLPALLHHATHKWFRLVTRVPHRRKTSTTPVHPLWKAVQEVFRRWDPDIAPKKMPPPIMNRSGEADKLIKQALGAMETAAAYRGYPVEKDDDLLAFAAIQLQNCMDGGSAERVKKKRYKHGLPDNAVAGAKEGKKPKRKRKATSSKGAEP